MPVLSLSQGGGRCQAIKARKPQSDEHWFFQALLVAFIWLLAYSQSCADISDCIEATCRISMKIGEESHVGTGTIFERRGDDYLILTNAHVVGTSKTVQVEFWRMGYQTPKPARGSVTHRWLIDGAHRDIAIVSVPAAYFGDYEPPTIPICPRDYKQQTRTVLSCGCARGSWPTAWRGHVTGTRDGASVEFTPSPANGRSGSALFDPTGSMIVGLVAWRDDEKGVGIAMHAGELYRTFDGKEGKTATRALMPISDVGLPFHTHFDANGRSYLESGCGPDGCYPPDGGSGRFLPFPWRRRGVDPPYEGGGGDFGDRFEPGNPWLDGQGGGGGGNAAPPPVVPSPSTPEQPPAQDASMWRDWLWLGAGAALPLLGIGGWKLFAARKVLKIARRRRRRRSDRAENEGGSTSPPAVGSSPATPPPLPQQPAVQTKIQVVEVEKPVIVEKPVVHEVERIKYVDRPVEVEKIVEKLVPTPARVDRDVTVVRDEGEPPPPRVVQTNRFHGVPVDDFRQAYEWAKKERVAKYPGERFVFESLDSMIGQFQGAR